MSHTATAMVLTSDQPDEVTVLVLRARRGDREAYGALVESIWGDLVALARGILAADLEAEDMVQDALVHAWPRLRMLRQPESFGAWMRRIVARRCLTRARRARPTLELVDVAGRGMRPDAGVDAQRLLAALAPRQRAVVYLTWIEGCTDREVGEVLGIKAATVRVHRHRGMQHLRNMVEADG